MVRHRLGLNRRSLGTECRQFMGWYTPRGKRWIFVQKGRKFPPGVVIGEVLDSS